MASLQAHLIARLLRWRIKRPIVGPVDILAARRSLDRPFGGKLPADVGFTDGDGPVVGEWVVSRHAAADAPVVLYLHGGGFFACSARTHRMVTAGLAQGGALRVFALDYRRAPEHRFPVAIEDAVACCRWLRQRGDHVAAVAGDSAGGALTLSCLLRLRDLQEALPDCGVAFSPVTDLAATGASIVENDRRDAMFFGASVKRLAEVYLPDGVRLDDPLASPLYADLRGLPPLLLHVGRDEVLRDDSVRLAEKARAAGVAVTLRQWKAVPHAWQVMAAWMPEGRESLKEVREFMTAAVRG